MSGRRRNQPAATAEPKASIRCAIYTRKSSDEGLDQEFNSLDAQRESAEAFIASQKAEGWTCQPDRYDDGGFSGGSMERPALDRLLRDIEAGKVDCVVVYKVDRLSRSLMDFARIMEAFDRRGVSFVSVTQQFNTTSSMGRLTLNILLSFAQFEREIIGERIRDKVAAQKRKGKWAGGGPQPAAGLAQLVIFIQRGAPKMHPVDQRACTLRPAAFVLAAASLAAVESSASFAQFGRSQHPYAVFELPTLGGVRSAGWKVSEWGDVIGSAFLPGSVFHPTVWIDGQTPVDLGTLGGQWGECRGINNNGWIVGRAQVKGQIGGSFSAFLLRDGVMENLGYLGTGDFAEAYGINDLNQIVGRSSIDPNGEAGTRAFIWRDGAMSELTHSPEYRSTEAIAINNSGLTVGQASSWEFSAWRPVVWQDGQIIDLGTFRSDNRGIGICIDVNEAGDVVGYAARDRFTSLAFVYRDGEKSPLPEKPYWRSSYAWSINDNRQVVGGVRTSGYGNESIGVIWEWNRPVRYLAHLIPPRSDWFLGSGLNINNAGQITGTGYRLSNPGYTKGYLLTPVHGTLALDRPAPGRAGEDNTFTIKRLTPGATVTLFASRKGGGTAIPDCTLQQNALQLADPQVIGTAVADSSGVAHITRRIPPLLRGRTLLLQAVVQNECAISQLVVHQFD